MRQKRIISFVLILFIVFSISACQGGGSAEKTKPEDSQSMAMTDPSTGETVGEAPEADLAVTPEENAEGWKAHPDVGFKYRLPVDWLELQDYIDIYNDGDPDNPEGPLHNAIIYDFLETSLIKRAEEIIGDDALSDDEKFEKFAEEIWPKTLKLMAMQLFRRDAFDKAESVEKLTAFPHNRVVAAGQDYVHIVSWADKDSGRNLPAEDRGNYNRLLDGAEAIVGSIQTAKPASPAESLEKIKNLTFNTVSLDGKPVDESIFSEAKLTMVNVWATWCGPCGQEIPEIGELAKKEFADRDVQVLGIVTDVVVSAEDEDAAETAREILSNSGASYVNVKLNPENMNDSLMRHIQVFPTTFFVDRTGSVVGSVIFGMRSKAQFLAEADSRLEMLGE